MYTFSFPIICWAFLTSSLSETRSIENEKQPNIVFILADDLGWNDVSFHGYNETPTPNIDRLAHEGVILNSHYSQYVCTPSRVALMTGKYPFRFGLQATVLLQAASLGFTTSEKLMPEYLKDLGYKTHLLGKWHLGYSRKSFTPTRRGFDSFFGYYLGNTDYFNYTATDGIPPAWMAYDLWSDFEPQWQYCGQYLTDILTEQAEKIISYHETDKPLFLYFAHGAPHWANRHDPVQAPQSYVDRFPHIQNIGRRKYAATISAMDDSVGRVFDALEKKGILNNTIIVFTSDNGGQGQESKGGTYGTTYGSNWPLRGAKGTEWEGAFRVPTMIWSPFLKQKARISYEMYHLTDWLPTLYKLAGGKLDDLPKDIDGFDVWNSVSDNQPSPREEIVLQINPQGGVRGRYALRRHEYKVVIGSSLNQWYEPEGNVNASYILDVPGALRCNDSVRVACDANIAPCLFNVVTDPCEYVNLALEKPEVLQTLLERLADYNATAVYPIPAGKPEVGAQAQFNDGLVKPWLPDE